MVAVSSGPARRRADAGRLSLDALIFLDRLKE